MNTLRNKPLAIAAINALVVLVGSTGMIFMLSLGDNIPFLTKVSDPVMMTILIACPIIAGAFAYFRARKNRLAANA